MCHKHSRSSHNLYQTFNAHVVNMAPHANQLNIHNVVFHTPGKQTVPRVHTVPRTFLIGRFIYHRCPCAYSGAEKGEWINVPEHSGSTSAD